MPDPYPLYIRFNTTPTSYYSAMTYATQYPSGATYVYPSAYETFDVQIVYGSPPEELPEIVKMVDDSFKDELFFE